MLQFLTTINLVSVVIIAIVILSALRGFRRGASSSARQLLRFALDAVVTVVCLLLSWKLSEHFSPLLSKWFTNQNIEVPQHELNVFSQVYYTFITAIRDFSLMRTALVFFVAYLVIRGVASLLVFAIFPRGIDLPSKEINRGEGIRAQFSSLIGAFLGAVTGSGRALLALAALFVYISLMPQANFSDYVRQSRIYQQGADKIIGPLAGNWLSDRLPVFTRVVQDEMAKILQRKYEVLDAHIPQNIVDTAATVTAKATTDEDKAKALYSWVGSRVSYDWDKYDLYVEQGIWKEQTPEDTFASREGVCIDYSRLYAVMAKSVGLEVRVVTGLGYDGAGGYGPHAWNEVLLDSRGWISLDSTWASSGGNWFNPPNFAETHIKQSI
ncbi:MAG: transglutaminase-like domain-containing protein [Gorillibacterium sp.]|nr:transglutaminase-like domain-containing protein [Gorillibacterium sp.]